MKKFSEIFKTVFYGEIKPTDFFAAFCTAFCSAAFLVLKIFLKENDYLSVNFISQPKVIPVFIGALAVVFIAVCALAVLCRDNRVIKILLTASALLFAMKITILYSDLNGSMSIPFILGIAFVFFLVVCYVCGDGFYISAEDISAKALFIGASAAAVMVVFMMVHTEFVRYRTYNFSCYDFGIFAEMFEKMRTTGLPLVTCERNTLMSHFGVHFSPFFYLLLPFYMIYPHPQTIIVLQALGVVSGFLPVIFLCRHFGLSNKISIACAIVYLLFPAIASPALTDFHENKFLSVLILWCVYFLLKKREWAFFVFAALTLTVKEDAAIYVIAIAAYIFFVIKDRSLGLIIGILSAAYFIFASYMVSFLGEGVMIDRLANFVPEGESGFLAVIKTCIFNIGYAISQIFTKEKVFYMIAIFLPLSFAPFLAEKKTSLILLLPMVAVNLMPNWQYQYDINFQYNYGSAALAIFLFTAALKEFKPQARKKAVLFSLIITAVMFCGSFIVRADSFIEYQDFPGVDEKTAVQDEFIAELPKDAEYTAYTYFIPHMYDFKSVYSYPNYYGETEYTEYLLVNPNSVAINEDGIADFISDKYELIRQENSIALYRLIEAE